MSIATKKKSHADLTVQDGADYLAPILTEERELASEYRRRKNVNDFKSVHPADVAAQEVQGWIVQRPGKRRSRLKRPKRHDRWLEDRFWCLLYSMGYRALNGANFKIGFRRSNGSAGTKQVDVYAEDGETALVVECKSRTERGRRSLQKDIEESRALSNAENSDPNIKFGWITRWSVLSGKSQYRTHSTELLITA